RLPPGRLEAPPCLPGRLRRRALVARPSRLGWVRGEKHSPGDAAPLWLAHAEATARAPAAALAALERARAAAIRPLNSGCGRVGRDRNSGCACVPTKNGWLLSSANSTRWRSGESPEKTRPACSSTAR